MKIAIILPCYNEEAVIEYSNNILTDMLQSMLNKKVIDGAALIYVDDGSCDKTWECITRLANNCQSIILVHGVKLAHNSGHQNALIAGITRAYEEGYDAVVTIDVDLQDDVNCIEQMVLLAKSGNDIVYGVRNARDTDTFFKRTTANFFYRLMTNLGCEIINNHADFRLMTRTAVLALLQYDERNLFLRGIVKSIGLPYSCVYYERKERTAGVTKYPLSKMINFAIEGITSFSTRPLRLISFGGIACIIMALILIIYGLYSFLVGQTLPGWTSLMISIWFVGGAIILALGVIGEYIGKIYQEVKNRPRYYVESQV